MKREDALLIDTANKCIDLYFSGYTPQQLYRKFNQVISRYLDLTDERRE